MVSSLIAFGDDNGTTPHPLFPRGRGGTSLQQIKDLEAKIGATLFHRVAHAQLRRAGCLLIET
jgi:hypothetical protein